MQSSPSLATTTRTLSFLIKLDGDRDFFNYGPISKEMVNGFLEAGLVNPPIEDMD